MSCDITYIKGYGWNISADNENVKAFICNHMNTIENIYNNDSVQKIKNAAFDIAANILEELDDIEDINTVATGAYTIVAAVMAKETELPIEYIPSGEQNDPAVILSDKISWEMNEKEKSLTEKEFEDIFIKYMKELKEPLCTLGRQEFEYF